VGETHLGWGLAVDQFALPVRRRARARAGGQRLLRPHVQRHTTHHTHHRLQRYNSTRVSVQIQRGFGRGPLRGFNRAAPVLVPPCAPVHTYAQAHILMASACKMEVRPDCTRTLLRCSTTQVQRGACEPSPHPHGGRVRTSDRPPRNRRVGRCCQRRPWGRTRRCPRAAHPPRPGGPTTPRSPARLATHPLAPVGRRRQSAT
jgi:hypothetical protein